MRQFIELIQRKKQCVVEAVEGRLVAGMRALFLQKQRWKSVYRRAAIPPAGALDLQAPSGVFRSAFL